MTFPHADTPPFAHYRFIDPETGVNGWLVVDTLVDGMSFGGFRFQESVTAVEVAELARCMTWKLAAHGLPTGGAKAGLAIRPDDPRVEDIVTRFAKAMEIPLREEAMLGRDMGATDAMIDRLYDTLTMSQLHIASRRTEHSALPHRLRELAGYGPHMTGRGVATAAQAAQAGSVSGKTVAIQGFGLVGAGSALRLHQLGAHIVGLADADKGVLSEHLDIPALADEGRSQRIIPHELLDTQTQHIPRDELLEQPVDILVLAAGSHSVDESMAKRIKAQMIVEGANFALTPRARDVLHDRRVPVIPDLIASSASAALVARQMSSDNQLSGNACWKATERSITEATRRALERASEGNVTCREAYLLDFRPAS
jgi:glutamate dehydrogenase (NAD(P)+)